MRSKEAYPRTTMERAMKVQDVMLQAMAKKIAWQAAGQAFAAPGAGGDGGESVRIHGFLDRRQTEA
jgi:hypothetical protein